MCDNKEIQAEIKSLCEKVDNNSAGIEQNNRALRGYNNTPGLVADVKSLSVQVQSLKEETIPHMKDDILKEIKVLQEKTVLWPVLGKVGGNIITAVVTAILITGLHAIFFP